jgi:hypothetical protein
MLREMRLKLSSEIGQLSHELNVVIPQAIAQAVELGICGKIRVQGGPSSGSSSFRPGWVSYTSG